MIKEQPVGAVTFLFTDVESSTRLWEEQAERMNTALAEHDRLIRDVVERRSGYVFTTAGDSFSVAFSSAFDAIAAATEVQREMAESPDTDVVRVRMGLHTGEATQREGDYFGPTLNRAARLMSAGHGGQILLSATTASVVRDGLPGGLGLADLGSHKLKDLNRPEQVYQLTGEGLGSEFPALRTLSSIPNNLPEQSTEFVGREAELTEVVELLKASRLVTILAPGGAGKSRLALEVGQQQATAFRHGVFFVPLAPLDAPDQIPQAISEALNLSFAAVGDTRTKVLDYLAGKEQLLILDNFEHLLSDTKLVVEILERAPGVRLIATSRTRLDLRGEAVYPLAGLTTTWSSPDEARVASGVELFVRAAQRRDPTFTVEDADLDALGRILTLVAGLPLAIELAAAWVDVLSVSEIATEIDTGIDFLEGEMHDALDRHRSIRAVFDYSWKTLTPSEREVFAALSVFRGGFTREAATGVAGADLRQLSGLVKKSLITADRASGRYTLHELLRQYAESKLIESSEAELAARNAHAEFFAEVSSRACEMILGGDIAGVLAVVEGDLDNLRTGWRFLIRSPDPMRARSYVEPLWIVHEIRGWLAAGRDLFKEAVGAISDGRDWGELAAIAQCQAGWFVGLMGDPVAGLEMVAAGTEILNSVAPTARNLCLAHQSRNINLLFTNPAEIEKWSVAGIEIAQRDRDEWWEMCMLTWRSYASLATGAPDGLEYTRVTLPFWERLGDHWVLVWVLGYMANEAEAAGRMSDAKRIYEQVLALGREIDFRRIIQYTLNNLGRVTIGLGEMEAANSYLLESLSMSRDLGHAREVLAALVDLAGVRLSQGREKEAAELVAAVLADPVSSQRSIYGRAPIAELAEEVKQRLESSLGPDGLVAALESGRRKQAAGVASELLGDS